jgi:hypothetical protein
MRKILLIFSVFLLLIGFISCSAKTPNSTNNSSKAGVTYTKEFSYLPAYSSNFKADSTPSVDKATGFNKATYTIKNTTNTEVFQNYESILKNNGWTIIQDQKPYSIVAKKDTHQATFVTQAVGKDVKLLVYTK